MKSNWVELTGALGVIAGLFLGAFGLYQGAMDALLSAVFVCVLGAALYFHGSLAQIWAALVHLVYRVPNRH